MSIVNPYLTRTAIRSDSLFYGRTYEISSIISRIYATQPQSSEIIGERRIGKSSLMHAVQRAIVAEGRDDVVWAMIDGQTFVEGDPAKLFAEVLGQVRAQRGALGEIAASYDGFRSVVQSLERAGQRLILLIDEFDVITRNPNFTLEFFNFLRSQATNHQVAYVLSTVKELESACHSDEVSGSPFFNIFFRLQLGPLLPDEAHELIVRPSTGAGNNLTGYEQWIVDRVGRFPCFIQIACARLFDMRSADSLELDRAEANIVTELRPYFDHMWRGCDLQAKTTLSRIANGGTLADIDQPSAQQLASRGYVIRIGDECRISALHFARMILEMRQADNDDAIVMAIDLSFEGGPSLTEAVVTELLARSARASASEGYVIATFPSADLAVGASSVIAEFVSVRNQKYRIVIFALDDVGKLLHKNISGKLFGQLSAGEVAISGSVANILPKTFERRLRKRAAVNSAQRLPQLFTLRPDGTSAEPKLFGVPEKGQNNVWYEYRASKTVYVFVHGIFSDSASCWLNREKNVFWPDLVRTDPRLGSPAIYLAGYFTDIGANMYDLDNCEHELFAALNRPALDPALRTVMQFERIVLICHSTGGIVARYMLERRYDKFASKQIGLVLIASPSYGSGLANKLAWLARLYKNRLGQQLEWGSWSLQELDSRFKGLLADQKLPKLRGIEACENRFVISRKLLPNITYIVNEESAGKYFGPAVLLRDTDHFGAVKPESKTHPSHEMLVDFYIQMFDR